ncbi:MAG TPA: hypothetical protein VIL31_04440 [Cyclobacteriaceae bacterium]|jgi:hypothetical protein
MPIVTDPRQNHHGWWGTVVDATPSSNGNSDVVHVFLKTFREAHYVSQGTSVRLEELGDTAAQALERLQKNGLSSTVLKMIEDDLANLKAPKVKIHHIVGINDGETTPLARMHNLVTEVCFNNDHWLNSAGEIGQKSIIEGRKLPSLKDRVAATK